MVQINWLQLSLALSSLATSTTATAIPLSKRESGLKCPTQDQCTAYYTTGSAQCSSGYERTSLEANGDPRGSYCEKACDESEKTACSGDKCAFTSSECNLFPGNSICGQAMQFCGTPIAMPKDKCNTRNLDLPEAVVYDDASGTCSVVDIGEKTYELDVRVGKDDATLTLHLYLGCAHLSASALGDLRRVNLYRNLLLYGWTCNGGGIHDKGDFDSSVPDIQTHCFRTRADQFKLVEEQFQKSCEAAQGHGDQKPVFSSRREN
ncbi:hypothetical protein BDW74DRAFT_183029 [Aspergillus multicolor]|uniref:uncharacterized protein n=1 Tax=Aspergillus multicolor TaxID=41759 RepID=UPI003CCD6A5E